MGMMLETLYQQGGRTLIGIVALSVLALGIGLERLARTLLEQKRLQRAKHDILERLRQQDIAMARAINQSLATHRATLLFAAILSENRPKDTQVRRDVARILRQSRQRLWLLGSIGALAPFVGLFGTVLGVMQAFQDMSAQGGGGFQAVSGGISEALITTAAGILVGVEAVMLFNYLQASTSTYAAELKEATEEISEALTESDFNGSSRTQIAV